MTRGREWIAGLVLAIGGVVAALLMLELGVRMLHLVPDRFWEPDPLLGARLIPGSHGWWTQEEREFVIPVSINSQGQHDVERNPAKAPGTVRVLILGDSFAEALHVPLGKGFPKVLERALNRNAGGRPIEVINAGVSGYGTASETLYFESKGWRYEPDIVLLAFYPGNDIRNNSPTLEDAFKPVYGEDGRLDRVQPTKVAGEANRGWLGRSAAYRFLRQLVLVRQPGVGRVLVKLGLMRPEAIRAVVEDDGIPVGFGMYEVPTPAVWSDAWQRTESLLDRLKRGVEERGARLAIAIVTAREQIYADSWQEILQAHPSMQQLRWDTSEPQHWVQQWCARRGVPCLDLADTFLRRASSDGPMLHYRHDGHWTEAGHELGGTLIAEFLQHMSVQ